MNISIPQTALNVSSLSQDVTANNLANINTDEFKSKRLDIQTMPDNSGVQVEDVVTINTPGPLKNEMQLAENNGKIEQQNALVEGSNTEPAREITQMIEDERSFEANAQVVKTYDQMAGRIIDMLV
jgi:flagellar basal-body rod protein FlgC